MVEGKLPAEDSLYGTLQPQPQYSLFRGHNPTMGRISNKVVMLICPKEFNIHFIQANMVSQDLQNA